MWQYAQFVGTMWKCKENTNLKIINTASAIYVYRSALYIFILYVGGNRKYFHIFT